MPWSKTMEYRRLKKQLAETKAELKASVEEAKKLKKQNSNTQETMQDTPEKEATAFLETLHLEPTESAIKKVIPLTETRRIVKEAPKEIKRNLFAGVKKRKGIVKSLAKAVRLSRKNIGRRRLPKVSAHTAGREVRVGQIQEFLKRGDNSYELPDKKKAGKFGLADTVHNLFLKYKSEYPGIKVGRSLFYSAVDPKVFIKVAYVSRNICLCLSHSNVHNMLAQCPMMPKSSQAVVMMTDEQIKERMVALPGEISFRQWAQVKIQHNGNEIVKYKPKVETMQKEEFIKHFLGLMKDFRPHCQRIGDIYSNIKILKETLKTNEIVCQLDYSENWAMKYYEEISHAFYNAQQVSLLPIVLNYRGDDGELQTMSYCGISDCTSHSAPTSFAFISAVSTQLRLMFPKVDTIHFISDSPFSQFRNKTIGYFVAHSERLVKLKATWTWLEAGHGKGPCDGVGGALKKAADNVVKGNVLINNADDFYEKLYHRVNIRLLKISEAYIGDVAKLINKWVQKKFIKINDKHCMIGRGNDSVYKEVPCFGCCRTPEGTMETHCTWLPCYRQVKSPAKKAKPWTPKKKRTTNRQSKSDENVPKDKAIKSRQKLIKQEPKESPSLEEDITILESDDEVPTPPAPVKKSQKKIITTRTQKATSNVSPNASHVPIDANVTIIEQPEPSTSGMTIKSFYSNRGNTAAPRRSTRPPKRLSKEKLFPIHLLPPPHKKEKET